MNQVISILVSILLLGAFQAAPAPQPPARVSVSGTVVAADSTEPLALVTITLVPLDAPAPVPATATVVINPQAGGRGGAGGTGRGNVPPPTAASSGSASSGVPMNISTTSDVQGKFAFPRVPTGRYSISAERDGLVRQEHYQSGATGPLESVLTVTAGMNLDGLILTMTEAPPITGIVYGVDGKRLAAAVVHAYQIQYTPYGRQLVLVATVLSHEGGEYRLFHLDPGSYIVSASYSEQSLQSWKASLQLAPNLSSPDEGYSTVYYPGELKLADAKVINLKNVREAANADITFKESQYYRLTVKVMLPPPAPSKTGCPCLRNPKVALLPVGTDLGAALDYRIKGSGANFTVDRLAAGDYVLVALADIQYDDYSITRIVSDTRLVRVTENMDVTIDAMNPFFIPGIVTLPGAGLLPKGMQVQLVRVDRLSTQTITSPVDEFGLRDVGPGTYDVFLKGMPGSAFLRDAGFSNADRQMLQIKVDANLPPREWHAHLDGTAELISDQGFLATMSPGGTFSGRVVDGTAKPFELARIIMVPTGPVARFRKDRYYMTTSNASGAFSLVGLAAGTYNVYAFQEIEHELYYDPDFNAAIAPRATIVNIGTGFNPAINLAVITADDLARYVR